MGSKSKKERRVLSRVEHQELQQRLGSSAELTRDDRETLLAIVECYGWTQQELQKANSSITRLKQFFGFSTEKKVQPLYVEMPKD